MSVENEKLEISEEEILDIVSSIANAPVDGYGQISKNKAIYITAFRKFANIVSKKLQESNGESGGVDLSAVQEYIENLPDNLALTENSIDENGSINEGTKAQWQHWLGLGIMVGKLEQEIGTVGGFYPVITDTWAFAEVPVIPKMGVVYYDVQQGKMFRWGGRAYLEVAVLPTELNEGVSEERVGEIVDEKLGEIELPNVEEIDKINARQEAELNNEAIILTMEFAEADTKAISFQNLSGDITIDWGDGTIEEFADGSTTTFTHEYATGKYTCKIYGCTQVGRSAFVGKAIKKAKISKNASIADFGFSYLTGCEYLEVPEGVISLPRACFVQLGYHSGKPLTIKLPNSLQTIDWDAFSSIRTLETLEIPCNVNKIGWGAFNNNGVLKTIIFNNPIPPTIVKNASTYPIFNSCPKLEKIIIKNASPADIEAYKTAQYWSDYASLIDGYAYQSEIEEVKESVEKLKPTIVQNDYSLFVATLSPNTEYYLGAISTLDITFPIANVGDTIYITFTSGETPTNLIVKDTNHVLAAFVPKANSIVEIIGTYNGSKWVLRYNEI